MLHKLPILFGTVLFATSCGGLWDTEDKGKKFDQNIPDLAGDWSANCLKSDVEEAPYVQNSYTFNALGDFTQTQTYFTDEQCKDEIMTFALSGTYADVGDSQVAEKTEQINLTITKLTATSKNDAGTDYMNKESICEIKDWATDKEREVTGKDCMGQKLSNGEVVFDIVQILDDKLYFGKGSIFDNKLSFDDRPTELNLEQPFLKE